MTKEVKPEVKEEAKPTEPIKEEVNKSTELIDKANDAADRLEAANKESEKLKKELEILQANTALDGKADAGQPQLTEEEKGIEQAKALIAGSGFEDRLFPSKKK
ncbi:hypothetical protein CMI37_25020 [Candidatus Pacearchaeota archaeon]|nr:hypothetical protein [Candidatus Pacearchaeota archaeon]|tara:strand:- start:2561 stop:2872 length:312 start_codon:yes stop_codon:yes gene_type:complete